MNANSPFSAAVANLNGEQKALFSQFKRDVSAQAKKKAASFSAAEELPGVVSPWGFWDPLSLSADISEGRLLYFREAELKHGRVCMLATVGFAVGELFHPINWGGVPIDKPTLFAFQETSLNSFWPAAVIALGALEYAAGQRNTGDGELPDGLYPGDLDWDPLGLKPDDPEDFEKLQNNEILHGRLAMISLLGQVSEELATGEKLHWPLIFTGAPDAVQGR